MNISNNPKNLMTIIPTKEMTSGTKNCEQRKMALIQSEILVSSEVGKVNKYLINFTGLNRTISKTAYCSYESMASVVLAFPKSKGIVGNLPAEWIQKLPKENREQIIKHLYTSFHDIAHDLRNNKDIEKISENLENELYSAGILSKDNSKNMLKKILQKVGVLNRNDTHLKLEEIKSGGHGTAYIIKQNSDQKYVIKVFHKENQESSVNGTLAEINRAAFWQKNAGKSTQLVRFYFGDMNAGYMVTKFINRNTQPPAHVRFAEIFGLRLSDVAASEQGLNKINGYQIEFGEMNIYSKNLLRNKKLQKEMKKILTSSMKDKSIYIEQASEDTKIALASILEHNSISKNEKLCYFDNLSESTNEEIKAILIKFWTDNSSDLFENNQLKYFNKLLVNASDSSKMKLVDDIYYLPEDERVIGFDKLLENANDNIKIQLVDNLCVLPINKRSLYFRKLSKNASDDVKKSLYCNIIPLPKKEQKKCEKLINISTSQQLVA